METKSVTLYQYNPKSGRRDNPVRVLINTPNKDWPEIILFNATFFYYLLPGHYMQLVNPIPSFTTLVK
jgi:hypothetical protein